MDDLEPRTKRKIKHALERAATQAGYQMSVRQAHGLEVRFSDFAQSMGTSLAFNTLIDLTMRELRRKGVKLKLGKPNGVWDKIAPDHFTVFKDGKSVHVGVRWNF